MTNPVEGTLFLHIHFKRTEKGVIHDEKLILSSKVVKVIGHRRKIRDIQATLPMGKNHPTIKEVLKELKLTDKEVELIEKLERLTIDQVERQFERNPLFVSETIVVQLPI